MKVYYDAEPEKIKYELLPNGTANVYLRRNIKQEAMVRTAYGGEETHEEWTAEETGFLTTATKEEVEAQFDNLVLSKGREPTLEERVSALEAAIMETEEN